MGVKLGLLQYESSIQPRVALVIVAHPLLREGIVWCLEAIPGIHIGGVYASVVTTLETHAHGADAILMDLDARGALAWASTWSPGRRAQVRIALCHRHALPRFQGKLPGWQVLAKDELEIRLPQLLGG